MSRLKQTDLEDLTTIPVVHDTSFRTLYDGLQPQASTIYGLHCEDPSLTQQHMASDCDINLILERHAHTGLVPGNPAPPSYGDFSEVSDFQEALNVVIAANDMFMELPAKLRERFGNNPSTYIDFCSDPNNRQEAISLGLLDAPTGHSSNGSPDPLEPLFDPSLHTKQGGKKMGSSTRSENDED